MQWGFALKLNGPNLILVSSLLLINFTWAKENLDKREVAEEVMKAIDLCIHWGGEEPFSEQRAKQIEEGIK